MSITFVAGSAATGSGTITITKPTGTVDNDVMYALFLQDFGSSGVSLTGWTQLGIVLATPGGFPTTLLRRVANGEGASYAFTANAASISEGVIWTYRGVDTTTPEDATTTIINGAAATITYPAIVTVTANAVHLALCENFNALASQPTGYVQRTTGSAWTTDSDNTYAATGTISGITSTGGNDWVARSVALRPAAGASDTLLGQAVL